MSEDKPAVFHSSSSFYGVSPASSDSRDTSLNELLAHRFACTEETILDGAERKPCDFRYLVIAHVV
jgi:hypothetical protein